MDKETAVVTKHKGALEALEQAEQQIPNYVYPNKAVNLVTFHGDTIREALQAASWISKPEWGERITEQKWVHVHTVEDMEAFFRSRLPAIREAARKVGYAIGEHGSARRDFDLMAMPWVEGAGGRDELAKVVQIAACGFSHEKYQWEQKPCGRVATCFPVCWTEWTGMKSAGHIDLSVMGGG